MKKLLIAAIMLFVIISLSACDERLDALEILEFSHETESYIADLQAEITMLIEGMTFDIPMLARLEVENEETMKMDLSLSIPMEDEVNETTFIRDGYIYIEESGVGRTRSEIDVNEAEEIAVSLHTDLESLTESMVEYSLAERVDDGYRLEIALNQEGLMLILNGIDFGHDVANELFDINEEYLEESTTVLIIYMDENYRLTSSETTLELEMFIEEMGLEMDIAMEITISIRAEAITVDFPSWLDEYDGEVIEVLEQGLVGVWQSDRNEDSFTTFLEDGTGYRGSTLTTRHIEWEKEGDELIIAGYRSTNEYKFRLEDEDQTLILIRQSNDREFSHSRVTNPDEVIANQRAYLDSPHHPENIDLDELADMNSLELTLLTGAMDLFETEHAISDEQARYLAFSPFLMMLNFESPHVFEINCLGRGTACAADILGDSWNVTTEAAAIRQLESLSSATGQAPIADDIWNTLIREGQTELLDPEVGFEVAGLERVVASASNRATETIQMILEDEDTLEEIMLLLADDGIEDNIEDYLYEMFVLVGVAERVNSGILAFEGASSILIEEFNFTEEELLEIETLSAWDYGRVSIIARYGVAAGLIDESVAWEHLQLAANNAVESYGNWREYAAAHILGRAIAFGNDSRDMAEVLAFLFNQETSPFQLHEFILE